MKKKSAHKVRHATKKKSSYNYSQIVVFIPVLLLVVLGFYKGVNKTHVLGAATGPLLAQGGDDSGSSSSESGSGSSGSNSGSNNSGSSGSLVQSGEPHDTSGSQLSGTNNPSGSATVDCIGPDGKHFTTEFHDCQELNLKWGRPNFTFTTLDVNIKPTPSQEDNHQTENKQNTKLDTGLQGKVEVQKEGSKSQFNLETPNLHIELHTEDDGKIKVTAKKEDGTEIQLESKDAVDTLNSMLDDRNIEVGTTSAHNLSIKSGNVEAETHFPLSVDPTTGELSITTPEGSKTVTVLPDQAVQNLLAKHIVTDVETQAASSDAGLTTSQQATLTLLGNEAVFEVNGVSNKHLLGIFPVGFAKTSFVSAQTGDVVKVNESVLNKLLETFSF